MQSRSDMPNHTIVLLVLIALIVVTDPIFHWGWGSFGRQEGFTPIMVITQK